MLLDAASMPESQQIPPESKFIQPLIHFCSIWTESWHVSQQVCQNLTRIHAELWRIRTLKKTYQNRSTDLTEWQQNSNRIWNSICTIHHIESEESCKTQQVPFRICAESDHILSDIERSLRRTQSESPQIHSNVPLDLNLRHNIIVKNRYICANSLASKHHDYNACVGSTYYVCRLSASNTQALWNESISMICCWRVWEWNEARLWDFQMQQFETGKAGNLICVALDAVLCVCEREIWPSNHWFASPVLW